MPSVKVDIDTLDGSSPLLGARFKIHGDGARQIRLIEFTSEFVEPHWCEKGHVGMSWARSRATFAAGSSRSSCI